MILDFKSTSHAINKKNISTTIIILILVMSFSLPADVLADHDNAVQGNQLQTVSELSKSKNSSPKIREYPLERIPKHMDLTPLSLTAEQKQTIQQMRRQSRLKVRQLRKSLISQQDYLRQLIFNPDATESEIKTARKNLHNIKDQVDEINLNDLLVIRELLTKEQLQKFPQCILPTMKERGQ